MTPGRQRVPTPPPPSPRRNTAGRGHDHDKTPDIDALASVATAFGCPSEVTLDCQWNCLQTSPPPRNVTCRLVLSRAPLARPALLQRKPERPGARPGRRGAPPCRNQGSCRAVLPASTMSAPIKHKVRRGHSSTIPAMCRHCPAMIANFDSAGASLAGLQVGSTLQHHHAGRVAEPAGEMEARVACRCRRAADYRSPAASSFVSACRLQPSPASLLHCTPPPAAAPAH